MQDAVIPPGTACRLHQARHFLVFKAVVQLEARLPDHGGLDDGIAEAELITNTDIALREVPRSDVLAKRADNKLVCAVGQLRLPALVVARVVLMDGVVGTSMRWVFALVAGKTELG